MLTVRAATPDDAAQISDLMTPLIVSGRFSAMQIPFDADETFTFLSTLPERAVLRLATDEAGQIMGLKRCFRSLGVLSIAAISVRLCGWAVTGRAWVAR
ncbi:MAG: hypothetical protein AAFQ36_05870 [Pseudomonadota bacterium]